MTFLNRPLFIIPILLCTYLSAYTQSDYKIDTITNIRGTFYGDESNIWYRRIIDGSKETFNPVCIISYIQEYSIKIHRGNIFLIMQDKSIVHFCIDSNKIKQEESFFHSELDSSFLRDLTNSEIESMGMDKLVYLNNVFSPAEKYFNLYFIVDNCRKDFVFAYHMKSKKSGDIENKIQVLRKDQSFDIFFSVYQKICSIFHCNQ